MPKPRDPWLDRMAELWGLFAPGQDGSAPYSIFARMRKVYGEDHPLACLQGLAMQPPVLDSKRKGKHDPCVAYLIAVVRAKRQEQVRQVSDEDPMDDFFRRIRRDGGET